MATVLGNFAWDQELQLQASHSMQEVAPDRAADEQARNWSSGINRGNPAALAELYQAWFDRLVTTVQMRTRRDESFALDVVQDVMLKVADSLPPLQSRAELERWMVRVCITTAIDHLRSSQRRSAREIHSQSMSEPELEIDQAQLQELEHALVQLSECQRELLVARFFRGSTLKQVGAEFGTSPDAVHGRIRRALQSLREIITGTKL